MKIETSSFSDWNISTKQTSITLGNLLFPAHQGFSFSVVYSLAVFSLEAIWER